MPQPWRYCHTQFGTVIVGLLAASALFLMGLGVALGNRVFIVGGPVMMGVAALLFYALTVEIDATHLILRFGVGLIRKRIPLAEIVAVKPVRNSWLYGWGYPPHPARLAVQRVGRGRGGDRAGFGQTPAAGHRRTAATGAGAAGGEAGVALRDASTMGRAGRVVDCGEDVSVWYKFCVWWFG